MFKSILTIATTTIVLGFGTAHAGHFSFEAKNSDLTVIGGTGPSGTGYVGTHSSGTVKTIKADGSEVDGTWECVSMASPINSKIFDTHMACTVKNSDGNFTLIQGCQMMNEDGSESSCVGGLQGKTGAYKGKDGNFSQYGKGDKVSGSGQWFK